MINKLLLSTLVGMIAFTGINYNYQAEAKNSKVKAFYKPVRKVAKSTKQLVYVFPLAAYKKGTFHFYNHAPAALSAKNAKIRGYKTSLYKSGSRWIVVLK